MRILLATAFILLASGCDTPSASGFVLSLNGTILDANGQPLVEPDVLLVGAVIREVDDPETPDVVYPLRRIEPNEAGEYELSYEVALPRVDVSSGGCVVTVGDRDVRLTLTAGDGMGGYASAVPDCSEARQRLDLVVENADALPEVASNGVRRHTR